MTTIVQHDSITLRTYSTLNCSLKHCVMMMALSLSLWQRKEIKKKTHSRAQLSTHKSINYAEDESTSLFSPLSLCEHIPKGPSHIFCQIIATRASWRLAKKKTVGDFYHRTIIALVGPCGCHNFHDATSSQQHNWIFKSKHSHRESENALTANLIRHYRRVANVRWTKFSPPTHRWNRADDIFTTQSTTS